MQHYFRNSIWLNFTQKFTQSIKLYKIGAGDTKLIKFKQILILSIICFVAANTNKSYSQDLIDDISEQMSVGDSRDMFTETIRIIGRSKRVFILTNTNQMLNKGDFITLVMNERDAVARAVVGKNHNDLVGIKILKVYSLKRWAMIRKDIDIKILKGDDSWLFKKIIEKKEVVDDGSKINSEEDLYDDTTFIDKDLDMFGKDNRLIKPDNIVSAAFARYTINNELSGDTEVYNQYSAGWAYQFSDNFWVEGQYSRILMSNVPASGAQTLINDLTFRLKYTFAAPLYSYFMPYIGYQIHSALSPNAGDVGDAALAEKEEIFVEELNKRQFIAGVTILKRLVPGWFLKADLGIDTFNIGFAIEF